MAASETVLAGKAATQDRILEAATELFIQHGYGGTTVSDVANRAGVSRATVFWHFSDKGGLFREAFARLLAPFRESLEADVSDVPPAKRLHEQLADSERFARERRQELVAFVRWALESPEHRDSVVTTLFDLNQRFAGVLTQTVSELVGPEEDPKLLATALMLASNAHLLLSLFETSHRLEEERTAAIHALASRLAGPVQRGD